MASIGAFCGPLLLWVAIFLASIQGVVFGLIRLRGRHRTEAPPPVPVRTPANGAAKEDDDDWVPDPHAVPFGPFLALGALETLFWGQDLVREIPLFNVLGHLP